MRMFDHVAFGVADYERSKTFYRGALEALGIGLRFEREGTLAAFGAEGGPLFIVRGDREAPGAQLHVAFTASERATVDAFHAAGLAAGGTDNGGPGVREYSPNYYGAFVLDPDGNNIEAVCHKAP
jgi:catechol 2,3-dioxygenase-like lactoylglutathione lyase family enzyme